MDPLSYIQNYLELSSDFIEICRYLVSFNGAYIQYEAMVIHISNRFHLEIVYNRDNRYNRYNWRTKKYKIFKENVFNNKNVSWIWQKQ